MERRRKSGLGPLMRWANSPFTYNFTKAHNHQQEDDDDTSLLLAPQSIKGGGEEEAIDNNNNNNNNRKKMSIMKVWRTRRRPHFTMVNNYNYNTTTTNEVKRKRKRKRRRGLSLRVSRTRVKVWALFPLRVVKMVMKIYWSLVKAMSHNPECVQVFMGLQSGYPIKPRPPHPRYF